MDKDFNSWNKQKKDIHTNGENKFYHPRDVWWCNLGVNVGYEQDGTGEDKGRPVVIIVGFSKNVCLIVPLTKSKKNNKYYIKVGMINNKEASVIISQIRLIDTKRLGKKIDVLDRNIFEKIRKAIRDLI